MEKNHTIIINLKYMLQHGMMNFELPDRWYLKSDIQDYFEYILKIHGENIDNLSIRIYVNKIKNRITFKLKQDIILRF